MITTITFSSVRVIVQGLAFLLLLWTLSENHGVTAQQTDAVCMDNFSWAENSRGQNPCLVAAYLQGACGNGQWTVPALPEGYHYNPPPSNATNVCRCSMVVYNLISCCGLCQDRTIVSWAEYSAPCDANLITRAGYPHDIPDGTVVPGWAYLDSSRDAGLGTFTAEAAMRLLDQPESSGPQPTSTTRTRTTGSPSTQTATSTPRNDGISQNVGPLVGGVVGGVVGVALILIALLLFLRRRRQKSTLAPNQHTMAPAGLPFLPPVSPPLSPPLSSTRISYSGTPTPYKLYDPNDPSTFPSDPSTFPSANNGVDPAMSQYTPSIHTGRPPSTRPGHYTGAPEL